MFWAETWKISHFLPDNFQFLVLKFSIYLNMRVFVMQLFGIVQILHQGRWWNLIGRNLASLTQITRHLSCLLFMCHCSQGSFFFGSFFYYTSTIFILHEHVPDLLRSSMYYAYFFRNELGVCLTTRRCVSRKGYNWVLVYDLSLDYYPPVRFIPLEVNVGCECLWGVEKDI